jgi:thymidylate kinase
MTTTAAVKRGAFILFEGIDRCGKTTQSARLVDALRERGHTVEALRFPGICAATGCSWCVEQVCVCFSFLFFECPPRTKNGQLERIVTSRYRLCVCVCVYVAWETDRSTAIGQILDSYLRSSVDLDDRATHLLFSANRWECQ